jgi:hypothetical protein
MPTAPLVALPGDGCNHRLLGDAQILGDLPRRHVLLGQLGHLQRTLVVQPVD